MATAIATALFLLLVAAPAAFGATQHVVGGASQWNLVVDYNAWAASQTFTMGDTLQFIYGASHSVDVVSQSDYGSCSSSSPIISYTGGNNIIALNSTGTTYFICPTPTHCDAGMKVSITVVAATPTPPGSSPPPSSTPTPSPPPPPTPNTSSPPPPSTPTNTSYPPPPPPSSASRIFGGKKHLLVEFSLLVIALIGFMG